MRIAIVSAVVVMLIGCGKPPPSPPPPEETFKGVKLSEWLKLSRDSDYETRLNAIRALCQMKSPAAMDAVIVVYRNDSGEAREAALRTCYSRIPKTELVQELQAQLEHRETTEFLGDDFRMYAAYLGPRASPLLPELKRVQPFYSPDSQRAIGSIIKSIEQTSPD
jgi:hypothetical protein